jgi:sulfite exporter TauE/SafE
MNNSKIFGYIMAIVGFIMILVNAVAYLFDLDIKNTAFTVMGLVFVVIGMGMVKNHPKNETKKQKLRKQ